MKSNTHSLQSLEMIIVNTNLYCYIFPKLFGHRLHTYTVGYAPLPWHNNHSQLLVEVAKSTFKWNGCSFSRYDFVGNDDDDMSWEKKYPLKTLPTKTKFVM